MKVHELVAKVCMCDIVVAVRALVGKVRGFLVKVGELAVHLR